MNTIMQKELLGTTGSDMPFGLSPTTVLVPMLNLGVADGMMRLAAMLAAGSISSSPDRDSSGRALPRVVVLGIVEVPQGQPLTTGLDMARSYRALLDFLPSEVDAAGRQVRVDHIVKVARDIASAVREAAIEEHAGLVLLYWKGYAREPKKHVYGRTADALLANPPCDVLLARPEGLSESQRILLPVRGGPAAERALGLAITLARFMSIPLTVMHTVPSRSRGEVTSLAEAALGEEPFVIFNEHLEAAQALTAVPIERILTVGDNPAEAVQEEILKDDLLIIGAPSTPPEKGTETLPLAPPRPVTLAVAQEKGPPLLVLRTYEPIDLESYARKVTARRSRKSWTDMPFEHWFVENTYHSDEYKDPEEFVEVKRASGLTLSIGLLTSNDARHLRSVITGLKKVLQEMYPVADQIAVIDAGSTDETVEIARSLGAEVYQASEILPAQGALPGHGESWWKSLSVLRGDIIVWLDPRAARFHPSTALALAWPLLRVPTLQLVKAFEPTHENKGKRKKNQKERETGHFAPVDMSWGGFVVPRREGGLFSSRIRVQALKPSDLEALSLAQFATLPPRTIVQVLSPYLAGVISPFGHDMAGRREAMLSLPAFTGGNFEVGILLSVAARFGVRAIAQVELRHAQPAPPPQPSLRTNIDLLQMLARRLEDPKVREAAEETVARLQQEMNGGTQSGDQDDIFEVRALGPVERPPMDSLLGG